MGTSLIFNITIFLTRNHLQPLAFKQYILHECKLSKQEKHLLQNEKELLCDSIFLSVVSLMES